MGELDTNQEANSENSDKCRKVCKHRAQHPDLAWERWGEDKET